MLSKKLKPSKNGTLSWMTYLLLIMGLKNLSAAPGMQSLDNITVVSIHPVIKFNFEMTAVDPAGPTLQAKPEVVQTKDDGNLGLENKFASIPTIGTAETSTGGSTKRYSMKYKTK